MSDTPPATAGEPEVQVLAVIEKLPDLETHVCLLRFPSPWNITAVELRDYVVSTGQYGLGYWLSVEGAEALAPIMERVRAEAGS